MATRREFLQAATGVVALAGWQGVAAIPAAPRSLSILMLGGTGFVGPHQVNYALARGHEVTLFNRGKRPGMYGDRVEEKAKSALQQIWQAATREDAERAFDQFVVTYEAKYPKATHCLLKDRELLMTFYDFPAVH